MTYLDRLLFAGLLLGDPGFTVGQSRPQPGTSGANFEFKGRYIVSVSDADMIPSAYIDGNLGPVEGQDALSVIRLDKPVGDLKAVEISVSNAVTGPPSVIDVSPDGRWPVRGGGRDAGPTPGGEGQPQAIGLARWQSHYRR